MGTMSGRMEQQMTHNLHWHHRSAITEGSRNIFVGPWEDGFGRRGCFHVRHRQPYLVIHQELKLVRLFKAMNGIGIHTMQIN